jgi:hypothetical protein
VFDIAPQVASSPPCDPRVLTHNTFVAKFQFGFSEEVKIRVSSTSQKLIQKRRIIFTGEGKGRSGGEGEEERGSLGWIGNLVPIPMIKTFS